MTAAEPKTSRLTPCGGYVARYRRSGNAREFAIAFDPIATKESAPMPEVPAAITAAVTEPVVVVRAWRLAVSCALASIAFAVLVVCAIVSHGCSGTQTPGATGAQVRTFTHSLAKVYCFGHRVGTPLILVAEARYPALTVVARTADLFCADVAANELALVDAADRVLPAGVLPIAPPTYSLSADGFAVSP